MYIESAPNRNSSPAILLRGSYREDGKVRKRTLCNLSDWPRAYVEGLRGALKGGTVVAVDREAFTVTRSPLHGHVAAALSTAHKIGLDHILCLEGNRCCDLMLAMIVGRILDSASKRATARVRCKTSRVARPISLIRGFHSVLANARAALNTSAILVSRRSRAEVIEVSQLVGWREAQAVSAFCSKVG